MAEVLYEVRDGVAEIRLNAPERRNAFTAEMVDELLRACADADADPAVGAVVLAANGPAFCSGAHRDTLARAGADPAEASTYRALGHVYNAFVRVGSLEAPVVAAVRGNAVGAGSNLMLAADLRVVAEDAKLSIGFLRIGLHPGGGHFTLMARLAGREAAAALSLFGEEVDGRRAVDLGLAWDAVPGEMVEPRAFELAARVARDPELARAAIRTLRMELGPPGVSWPVALETERAAQMWSLRRRH